MDQLHPHLHAYFEDHVPPILDEATYKDFMAEINPNNLPHRDYAPLIPFSKYIGTKGNITKWFVPNHYNGWNCYIQFVDWDEQIRDKSLTAPEVARLLLWSGNIRVHCPDPSYTMWGYAYILTQLDAAIIPEVRFPHIRNPHLKGICCKHIRVVLKTLPFHLGDLAAAIKEQRKNL